MSRKQRRDLVVEARAFGFIETVSAGTDLNALLKFMERDLDWRARRWLTKESTASG